MEAESLSLIQGLAKFMNEGGIFMWVILFMWLIGLVISVERFIRLQKLDINGAKLLNDVHRFLLNNNIQGAVSLCSSSKAAVASVLKVGLKRINKSKNYIEHSMQTAILEVTPKIDKRLNYLSLIANVSTLVGLLGTIYGLIESFGAVANADPSEKSQLLALGISKAMNTTALGLISAITIMVSYTLLSGKAEKIFGDLDEFPNKFINLISANEFSSPKEGGSDRRQA